MKIRKCVICGKAFAPEDVRKLTCSAECTLERRRRDSKARYWAKKKEAEKRYGERICVQCGKKFLAHSPNHKTCSSACSQVYRRLQRQAEHDQQKQSQDDRFREYGLDYGKIRARELLDRIPPINVNLDIKESTDEE